MASKPARTDRTGLAGIAVVGLAVACCAGGPLLVALVGSLAVGALIGIGAAVLLLIAAGAWLYLRRQPNPDPPGRSP